MEGGDDQRQNSLQIDFPASDDNRLLTILSLLREILEYTYNPYRQYHVVKFTPQTDFKRDAEPEVLWNEFFALLDRLDSREITGGDAVNEVETFIGEAPELTARTVEEHEKFLENLKVVERFLFNGVDVDGARIAIDKTVEFSTPVLAHAT